VAYYIDFKADEDFITGFLYFWHLGRPIIINRKLDLSYYTGDIPDETIVGFGVGQSAVSVVS
jgi:hypothetical protein